MGLRKRIRLPFAHPRTGRRDYVIFPSVSALTFEEFSGRYTGYYSIDQTERLIFASLPAFVSHLQSLVWKNCLYSSFHNSCIDEGKSLSLHYEIPKQGVQRVALYGYRRLTSDYDDF